MNIRRTVARRVEVSGRVQGVGFRWFVCENAQRLGVTGWVRNLADGCVEAWIQGEESTVTAMLQALECGPSHARVTGTVVTCVEPESFTHFETRR